MVTAAFPIAFRSGGSMLIVKERKTRKEAVGVQTQEEWWGKRIRRDWITASYTLGFVDSIRGLGIHIGIQNFGRKLVIR
jgi:hypothetical protein